MTIRVCLAKEGGSSWLKDSVVFVPAGTARSIVRGARSLCRLRHGALAPRKRGDLDPDRPEVSGGAVIGFGRIQLPVMGCGVFFNYFS